MFRQGSGKVQPVSLDENQEYLWLDITMALTDDRFHSVYLVKYDNCAAYVIVREKTTNHVFRCPRSEIYIQETK